MSSIIIDINYFIINFIFKAWFSRLKEIYHYYVMIRKNISLLYNDKKYIIIVISILFVFSFIYLFIFGVWLGFCAFHFNISRFRIVLATVFKYHNCYYLEFVVLLSFEGSF